MDHYIPLFSKIVDSSLWDEPDFVVKVFLSMLAKKEKNDLVIASAYAISRWARKSEAETLEALKILSSPDTKRLEPQPFDGRRIEKVEGGWRILNGEFYQREMQKLNRREHNRISQQAHRDKEKAKPATPAFVRNPIDAAPPGAAAKAMRAIFARNEPAKPEPAPEPKPDPTPTAAVQPPAAAQPPPVRRQLTEQERKEQARLLREVARNGVDVAAVLDELAAADEARRAQGGPTENPQ